MVAAATNSGGIALWESRQSGSCVASEWSEVATWGDGLRGPRDWKAQWIEYTAPPDDDSGRSAEERAARHVHASGLNITAPSPRTCQVVIGL